ncbi:MAG: hypothetical protein P1U88_14480 [Thalassobaculaceae bacterium]|nr:hypothetical protein [Thalassobaculaceae bacterium]
MTRIATAALTLAAALSLASTAIPVQAAEYYALFMDDRSACVLTPTRSTAFRQLATDRRFQLRSNSLVGLAAARSYARAQFCRSVQKLG